MTENFFSQKTAIVTGASAGIGREIAKEFAMRGAKVIATARRQNRLEQLAEECASFEGKCIPLAADIMHPASAVKIVEAAMTIAGRIDILVNNAAIGFKSTAIETPEVKMQEMLTTNLVGPIKLTQQAIRVMIGQASGSLVFVTSLAGKMGFPGLSVYSASKFGIEGFVEALRSEIAGTGIDVTVLRPGVTDTEFFDVAGMHEYPALLRKRGKIHSPEAVARYLADKLPKRPTELTFGTDRFFLKLLPFIPHHLRLKFLSFIN